MTDTPDRTPERPLNVPPPQRPMEPNPEGWERFWIPVTVVMVLVLVVGVRAIMKTGEPWVECQLQYMEATNEADSAAIDRIRVGTDGADTCGGLRLERT